MDLGFIILNVIILLVFCWVSVPSLLKKGYKAFSSVLIVLLTISFIATLSIYGMGHTWDFASKIGKLLALFIAISIPLLIAATTILVLFKNDVRATYITGCSFIVGAIVAPTIPIVGVILACMFTGDCL